MMQVWGAVCAESCESRPVVTPQLPCNKILFASLAGLATYAEMFQEPSLLLQAGILV